MGLGHMLHFTHQLLYSITVLTVEQGPDAIPKEACQVYDPHLWGLTGLAARHLSVPSSSPCLGCGSPVPQIRTNGTGAYLLPWRCSIHISKPTNHMALSCHVVGFVNAA